MNVITTSSSNNNQVRRGGSIGLKLWQLGLLLICCLLIPVGQASPNKTIGRRNCTTGRAQVSWPQLISMITVGWKSASPWIEYSFGLTTGILLGFSIIMTIGLIIMRRQGARLKRVGYGLLILQILSPGGAVQVTNNTNLGLLFGLTHV